MQRKSFSAMQCPIARSLERVGEWWSILILRDAFQGLTQFDQFQKSLGIAPNMLTRRLNTLVENGLLERRRYSERPPRDEYVLTEKGRDFRPVLWALLAWGNKHWAPEGARVVVVDAETGLPAEPVVVDRVSGKVMTHQTFRSAPGPAADADTRAPWQAYQQERTYRNGSAAMSDQVISRDVVPPATKSRPKLTARRLATGALGLAVLVGAGLYAHNWWTVGRFIESTDDAYVGGNVTPIAPHVAGFVQQILVTDNQYVEAGQPLIRLDPADYNAALAHAQAVLQARQATIVNLQAKRVLQHSVIAGAEADLTAKQAQAVFATQEAERYRSLATTAAGSRQDEQKAQAADKAAKAAVLAAGAAALADNQQLGVLDAEIAVAKADLTQAEADVRTAQLNLGYTEIVAPVAGYVGNRYAQVGAYVTAGTNLMSIVPAQGLWVDANFKEDQLAHMKPGDAATIVADVLPGRVFQGHVASLSPATGAVFSVIPPQNATGNFTKIVQRVPVRIMLDRDGQELGLLRAGLSTTASVDIRHSQP